MLELKDYLLLASFLVSVIACWVGLSNRRDSTSHGQIVLMLAPILKDVENAKLAAANAQARMADQQRLFYELEIKLLDRLKSYPTTDHFDATISNALKPILEHVARTEAFMYEVARSGVLAPVRK